MRPYAFIDAVGLALLLTVSRTAACKLLIVFTERSAGDAGVRAALAAGAAPVLVRLTRCFNMCTPGMSRSAVGLMLNYGVRGGRGRWLEVDGVGDAALAAADAHAGDAQLATVTAHFLAMLVSPTEAPHQEGPCVPPAVAASVLAGVLKLAARWPEEEPLAAGVATALGQLGEYGYSELCVGVGAHLLLLDILKRFSRTPRMAAVAASGIAYMLLPPADDDTLRPIAWAPLTGAIDRGLVEALAAAALAPNAMPELFPHVTHLLYGLSERCPGNSVMPAVRAVMKMMRGALPDDTCSQTEGCLALIRLAQLNDEARRAVIQARALVAAGIATFPTERWRLRAQREFDSLL